MPCSSMLLAGDQPHEAQGDEHQLRAGHGGGGQREPARVARAERGREQRPEGRRRQVELDQRQAAYPRLDGTARDRCIRWR